MTDTFDPGREHVAIRAATDQDLPRLIELWEGLDREQADWRVFPPRATIRDEVLAHYRTATTDPSALHLVAEEGERLVAMALGKVIIPSSFSDEPGLEISNVYVQPSHRGRGLGGTLTRALVRFARERGVQRVMLWTFAQNEGALRFWQGLGFRPRVIQLAARVEELPGG